MPFFTVNHTLHTLHTVKPGSKLETLLNSKSIGERLNVMVAGEKHSVFETAIEAKDFAFFLSMHGNQS